ncbi:hypothetical protein [Weissella oryzae]|nr:hypothetical protein [Weissella oryzae]
MHIYSADREQEILYDLSRHLINEFLSFPENQDRRHFIQLSIIVPDLIEAFTILEKEDTRRHYSDWTYKFDKIISFNRSFIKGKSLQSFNFDIAIEYARDNLDLQIELPVDEAPEQFDENDTYQ